MDNTLLNALKDTSKTIKDLSEALKNIESHPDNLTMPKVWSYLREELLQTVILHTKLRVMLEKSVLYTKDNSA